jgi:hypothetical protein
MATRCTFFVGSLAALSVTACGHAAPDDVCMGPTCVDAIGLFDIPDVPVDRVPQDVQHREAAVRDASAMDATSDGYDVTFGDTRLDTPPDFGTFDSGRRDTGVDIALDHGPTRGCVSGAFGTFAVRFQWTGAGDGSPASARYETSDLPDTSRMRVTTSSGFSPVFVDTSNGGGLDLEGTAYVEVDFSTVGLTSIRDATDAVYGRSFSASADGSYHWESTVGSGDSLVNSVSHLPPYRWYLVDAFSFLAFPADNSAYVRISAGASSSALVVSRVEICFDAS